MLKNNEQRKQFILNDENWDVIHELPDIATKISLMVLPNNEKILKYDVMEERAQTFYCPGVHNVTKYRILKNNHVTDEVSMTYLIELLKKVK